MLYIFRFIIIAIYSTSVCALDSIYCLLSLCNPKHVATFGHMLDCLASLFGLKAKCCKPVDTESYSNAIYVANYQNNYDMVTASNIAQPLTMMVGKKSLLRIPFFRQLYRLTGNLLVDGNNRTKAHGTIAEVVNHFKKRRISVQMFSEGIRSYSHGLLPFRTGTFHAAVAAGVPIIPVRVSTTSSKVNPNRLHNGPVVVEMLPLIDASQYGKDQVCELAAHCHSIIEQKIAELDKGVTEREAAGKV